MRQTSLKTSLRRCAVAGTAIALASLAGATAQANDPVYSIDLNKTQILRLPSAAGAIVVGNPGIADVSLHSPTTLFVVGRGFGETNLIILDRDGNTLVDADIQVTSTTPTHGTRLFNAGERESYSCVPYCQPSPVLGDSASFLGDFSVETETNTGAPTIFESSDPTMGGTGFQGFNSENAEAMVAEF